MKCLEDRLKLFKKQVIITMIVIIIIIARRGMLVLKCRHYKLNLMRRLNH